MLKHNWKSAWESGKMWSEKTARTSNCKLQTAAQRSEGICQRQRQSRAAGSVWRTATLRMRNMRQQQLHIRCCCCCCVCRHRCNCRNCCNWQVSNAKISLGLPTGSHSPPASQRNNSICRHSRRCLLAARSTHRYTLYLTYSVHAWHTDYQL